MISIPVILTEQRPCSYLDKRNLQSAFIHPISSLSTEIYSELISLGFRRSGDEVYIPQCKTCKECVATRLNIKQFVPSRNQKRCLKKNQNTIIRAKPAEFDQAHYDLYIRYQRFKHGDSDMAYSTEEDYINFLGSNWCNTLFVEFLINEKLVAVTVVDILENSLSAVYTFFDPLFSQYSLGTYAVLWQLNYAKRIDLEFVYLGFWIKDCQKMSYKTQFKPIEGYIDKEWKNLG